MTETTATLFENLNLSPEVLKAVHGMEYEQMTPIQASAIPLVMAGRDIIGRSSTGTGKTAAFGIPAVESIKEETKRPQVLILSPTRELAMQISEEMHKYAKYKPMVRIATVYGGQSMEIQIRQLKTANIVVGTPGRIMDHMRRRTLRLDDLKTVILDEADEMLNMGFYEDIQTILSEVPQEHQTLLFSATMPPAILKITEEFQKNPQIVTAAEKGKKATDVIKQYFYYVPSDSKMEAINLLLQMHEPKRSLIFCNTKRMVDELVDYLNDSGFSAIGLHGDMRQMVRSRVMHDYKTGKIQILVASDVAARGIDVEDIEAVFNFDIPQENEYYIHRIGRTGRAGKQGVSYSLVCNGMQLRRVREIKNALHVEIEEQNLPSAEQIKGKRDEGFLEKFILAAQEDGWQKESKLVEKLLSEGFAAPQIAAVALSFIKGKEGRDIPTVICSSSFKNKTQPNTFSSPHFSDSSKVRLSVNLGSDQEMVPKFIVGAIAQKTGLSGKAIGKINIYKDHTDLEMTPEGADIVMKTMQNSRIRNHKATFVREKAKNRSR